MLDQIPPAILQSVRRHLQVVTDFTTEVERCRALERRFGSAGRYEWEYRTQRERHAWQSWRWLARVAALAPARGVDAPAVYAALGQAATWPPWSEAARVWMAAAVQRLHQPRRP